MAIEVAGKLERDTLSAKPNIVLVFLNLPDGKDGLPGRTKALENLWNGGYPDVTTLVPTGSVVDQPQKYTANQLTQVLAGLFDTAAVPLRARSTHIRTTGSKAITPITSIRRCSRRRRSTCTSRPPAPR